MKDLHLVLQLFRFIVRTMRVLSERIEKSWYKKRYMAFSLNIISALLFIGLIAICIYALYAFFAYIGSIFSSNGEMIGTLLLFSFLALIYLHDKITSSKQQPVPQVPQNDESRDEANTTYETVIHPNMMKVFEEAAKYYPIYPPSMSSILPPNGAAEGITDKGSHWLFEVRAKLRQDVTDEEVGRIEKGLQDIIAQKLAIHELSNLDTEKVQDAKGASHSKLQIDSVLVAQDNLLVYVAIASVNYFNYRLANPRRGQRRNHLFDDLFKNL